jgi:hypothetical protein
MIRRMLDRLLRSYRFGERVDEIVRARTAHARFSTPRQTPLPPLPARYARAQAPAAARAGEGAIFVTARFRTGSTFLWQLFNRIDGFAAFYEPLNERHGSAGRWDPDPTHRGVVDYRAHYDRVGDLRRLHRQSWAYDNLYMDEGDRDPDLFDYVAALVGVPGVVPVLQFNRVDFRLRWLRAHFPGARIVHLYRDPREQWMSAVAGTPVGPDTGVEAFAPHDRFYLLAWARDLARVYPFLLPSAHRTPYALHYLIWRLSHAHGVRHADVSVAYEDLVADVPGTMARVLARCGQPRPAEALRPLASLAGPTAPPRWPGFAPGAWFDAIEAECERQLAVAFAPR